MKKLLSLFLTVVLAVNTLFASSLTANANSLVTAVPVYENQPYSTYVSGTIEKNVKSWVKFDCTASGYYEFVCSGAVAPDGPVHITVYDSLNNVLNYAVNASGDLSFSAVTYLIAGNTYYFCVEINGTLYNFDITVKQHIHNLANVQQVRAVADDTEESRRNGFTRISCTSCGEFYDTGYYGCPSVVSLSKEKFAFDGTQKFPTVTVYDVFGNVIPSSEYTALYEDNVLVGKAFVTVSFNSAFYEGELTKSFFITPKKQSVGYLNSKKSKSITVKWTKDNHASGYELQYSTSSSFSKRKTKTVIITKKSTVTKTIQKLQSNKKYYVRVRSYKTVNSSKLYGSWSNKKSVKTKK